ncbi:MAG: hypothetical protein M3374_03440 [Pseudomonadota bacterium]|nr:hypothetical protein [Pseudomonadota bacterium]
MRMVASAKRSTRRKTRVGNDAGFSFSAHDDHRGTAASRKFVRAVPRSSAQFRLCDAKRHAAEGFFFSRCLVSSCRCAGRDGSRFDTQKTAGDYLSTGMKALLLLAFIAQG